MSSSAFAHSTPENPLRPRVVYVCPLCGWWKEGAFECRHMVTATDGDPAFRDYRADPTTFYLWGDVQRERESASDGGGER